MFAKEKKARHFTFMLIPHTTQKPRSLRFSVWALRLAGVFGGIFFMAMGGLLFYVLTMQADYQQVLALKQQNQQQAKEIEGLNQHFSDLQARIADIDVQEKNIRRLMGLESETKPGALEEPWLLESNGATPQGQGGIGKPLSALAGPTQQAPEENFSPREIQLELGGLIEEIATRENNLKALKQMVKEAPAYYRAIPNHPPARGRLTSPFGERRNPFGGNKKEMHDGIDLANVRGTPIYAAGEGEVSFAGVKSGYGKLIVIKHGYGFITHYGHNSALLVKQGDKVEKGEKIALMGSTGRSTGPHVHFSLQKEGEMVDPLPLLDFDR